MRDPTGVLSVRDRIAGAGARLLLLVLVSAAPAAAQQFVTDDAALVEHRACQLEAWHGSTASWILPACQALRNLEITAGVGFLDEGEGRDAEWVLHGKTLFREHEPDGFGWGLVAGVGVDPLAQVTGSRVTGIFAYVPATLALAGERLLLHGNLGWHMERDAHDHADGEAHEDAHHALTWAMRGDLALHERFALIGELFGEGRIRPELQVGLRSALLAERLTLDVSWGGHTARRHEGTGWVVGLAWTPPPFF